MGGVEERMRKNGRKMSVNLFKFFNRTAAEARNS